MRVWDATGIVDDTTFGKDDKEKEKEKQRKQQLDKNQNGIEDNKIMIDWIQKQLTYLYSDRRVIVASSSKYFDDEKWW